MRLQIGISTSVHRGFYSLQVGFWVWDLVLLGRLLHRMETSSNPESPVLIIDAMVP